MEYNGKGSISYARVAQSVEQLIRNQQVVGSIPISSPKEKSRGVHSSWGFLVFAGKKEPQLFA